MVLAVDASQLKSEVKFEAAAAVGDKKTYGLVDEEDPVLFPHLVRLQPRRFSQLAHQVSELESCRCERSTAPSTSAV